MAARPPALPRAAACVALACVALACALSVAAAALPWKAGACPPPAGVHVCVFKCYDDGDCAGAEKCCKTLCGGSMCMNPVTPPRPSAAREGLCPRVNATAWVCRNRCSADSDCRAANKCCQHRCGGYACLPAVRPPPPQPRPPPPPPPPYPSVVRA